MSLPVVYLPEAEDDVDTVFGFYEGQQAGLGWQFLQALCDLSDRIRDHPHLYGVFRRDIRAAPLRRFPYVVYYRVRSSDVLIIAVQHGRRSSRGWRGRT